MFLPGCATLCEGRSSSAMVSSCYVCYGRGAPQGGLGSVGNSRGCTILLMEIITCFQWKGNIYGPKKGTHDQELQLSLLSYLELDKQTTTSAVEDLSFELAQHGGKALDAAHRSPDKAMAMLAGRCGTNPVMRELPGSPVIPKDSLPFFFSQKVKESMLPHIRP